MIVQRKLWLNCLIAFIPIVLIVLMVYIYIIYPASKFELSSVEMVDVIYRRMNATRFRFGCAMSVVASFMLSFICAILYNAYKIYVMAPIKVTAKLKSKYISSRSNTTGAALITIPPHFELNFELENKELKQFYVTPEQFSFVFENNKGILTYKEHSKMVYLDFEVLEVMDDL